jgi:hypothetical protein
VLHLLHMKRDFQASAAGAATKRLLESQVVDPSSTQ